MTTYDPRMGVERITVSLDAELAAALRDAAAEDDVNVSTWVSEAVQRSLDTRGLRAVISEWEAEHGQITEEEIASARKELWG